ncbi:FAD-dependent oxidoreductase [Paenibacillus sp. GCM10023252]|uniref:FAD-dependent oxidoreductase n=1 Tax=Paenibacillus sp. GCM10023252 TaxID=3252649 RepID=UPI003605D28D
MGKQLIHTDVLVVGGGTSGIAAAFAAADLGVHVILVESGDNLGGIGPQGSIHSYCWGVNTGSVAKMDQGIQRFTKLLGSKAVGFHPEAKKLMLHQELIQRSIQVIYQAMSVSTLVENGSLSSVTIETPERTIEIGAMVTIDCTANGDLSAMAGAPYTEGRPWDGVMHAYSLPPRIWKEAEQRLDFRNFDAGWLDSGNARDYTAAFLEGRYRLWESRFLEQNEVLAISSHLGVREGKLIQGEYVLQPEDLIMNRHFDDVVMQCLAHFDNHAFDIANESDFSQVWNSILSAWDQKIGGEVPYRCFVPLEVDGLLIGCRALSMTHDVHTLFRMQRDIQTAGEVAGTAAGLSVKLDVQPRQLDVRVLQGQLIARDVIRDEDLQRESKPWVTLNGDSRSSRKWTQEQAEKPETWPVLLDALGTDEEGKALFWFSRVGEAVIPFLLNALQGTEGKRRRGVALALALLGNVAGAGVLIESVGKMDQDRIAGWPDRNPPRWIASLVSLQRLKHPGAIEILVDNMAEGYLSDTGYRPFMVQLHVLHYLITVSEHIQGQTRTWLIRNLKQLLTQDKLGAEWPRKVDGGPSIRWSLDLNIAYLLAKLDDPEGERILEQYLRDERMFARKAAMRIRSQFQADSVEAV